MREESFQLQHSGPTKRAAGGARAKDRGEAAESAVERLHENDWWRVANPGVCLRRRHPRTVVVDGVARQISPQGPDFGGGAPADRFRFNVKLGLWLEVEVKFVDSVERPRLEYDRFTDAEVEVLSACRAAAAVAIVLVLLGPSVETARWCAVPWGALEAEVRAHRSKLDELARKLPKEQRRFADAPASVPREQLERYVVQPFHYLVSAYVGPGR
jgi:hypothetical protein